MRALHGRHGGVPVAEHRRAQGAAGAGRAGRSLSPNRGSSPCRAVLLPADAGLLRPAPGEEARKPGADARLSVIAVSLLSVRAGKVVGEAAAAHSGAAS